MPIQYLKKSLSSLLVIILFACQAEQEDDCLKTIVIPQFYLVNNQSYSYDTTLEVPCDFEEPTVAKQIDPPFLENFSYEVLSFTFTPDTGNNTSRLVYEIKMTNPNNYAIKGFPYITLSIDGLHSSSSPKGLNGTFCSEMQPNETCLISYSQESNLDIGLINDIKLIDVQYILRQ